MKVKYKDTSYVFETEITNKDLKQFSNMTKCISKALIPLNELIDKINNEDNKTKK